MEEVSKESGHRPSVSMPSLDATDDFPSHTENSEPVFGLTDSYISTASTDTVVPSEVSSVSTSEGLPISTSESISTENTQSVGESSTGTLTEEVSKESLIEAEPANNFIENNSGEPLTDGLIEGPQTATLTDPQSEVLQSGLDESQVEEDDSIAIDQFIKKIADEQLSSKRIEERKEEEAQEQGENDGTLNDGENKEDIASSTNEEANNEGTNILSEEASESHGAPMEEAPLVEEPKNPITETNDNSTTGALPLDNIILPKQDAETEPEMKPGAEPEPMEVESETPTVPSQTSDTLEKQTVKDPLNVVEEDEQMQAESIEEIQKEINRIPPKKPPNNDESSKMNDSNTKNSKEDSVAAANAAAPLTNSNSDDHMEDESIEQILSSGLDLPKVGNILKSVLEHPHKTPSIEDSAEVAKDPVLIEKAQEEIKKLDVLVCGECHNAFYYMRDFADHKKGKCPQVSCITGLCEAESKPQVWGFILWKIKQIKELKDGVPAPSNWSIYQTWCKLPQADKNAWITAGQSIQFASKIANAKVTEVRPAKPAKQTTVQKVSNAASSPPPLEFVDSNKENSSHMDFENSPSHIIKKGFAKPVRLNNDVTILPSTKNPMNSGIITSTPNTAVRTTKVMSTKKDEFVVERIMAKRFNPRKKTWEYNIKWENFGHDSNTWEPIGNLSHCKKLLEQFEEQLKRMKEEKAKQAAQSQKSRGRPSNPRPMKPSATSFVPIAPKSIATISNVVGGVSDDYAGGGSSHRPTRSSKQKAMNQVKEWCGNISDDDASGAAVGLKRKHESDDSDEDFDDKKIKLEEDSDYSDKDVKPKITLKKYPSTFKPNPAKATTHMIPVKNGNANASQQVLPSNILIPDANGVVRINQKQLPALSSGVYIMSKTAGIIKLDSTTSKVATSGGQTIVKVAPKIGQTQIKIVKKDGNTTKQIIQVSPKTPSQSTPLKITSLNKATPKITQKIRREVKKHLPLMEPAKVVPKKPVDVPSPKKPAPESDSDDGLEPLPFPDPDEPIPDLEEDKDEEFVLDPATGKLAGVEYVDKPVVIKEEPQPGPPSTNELENIVKMVAADLSDEDLHNNDSQDEARLLTAPKEVTQTPKAAQKTVGSGTPGVRKVVKYTVGGQNSAILNKSLMQGHQKPGSTVVKSVTPQQHHQQQQQRRVAQQQKVINQMVSSRGTPGQTRTVVRHVIEPTRPGQGGNLNVIRKTVTSTPRPKFNLSPQKPLPSPLQPTRTYSAMGGVRQAGAAGPGSKVQVYSAKSNVSASPTAYGQMHGGIRRIGNTVVRATSGGQMGGARHQGAQQHATHKQPVTRIVQRVVASPKKPAAQQVSNAIHAQSKPAKPRTVINMPSLTEDDTPSTPTPKVQQQKATTQQKVAAPPPPPKTTTNVVKQEPVSSKDDERVNDEASEAALESGTAADQTDWSSFTMADGDNPIYVTGDDGTIYQVAGQNEQGQTILITQGADGQQQCLLVTNEISEMAPDEPQPSTSTATMSVETETAESEDGGGGGTTAAAPPVTTEAQEVAVPISAAAPVEESSLQTPLQIKTDSAEMEEAVEDGVQDQVVAQVVRAEPPSPGGTHKVVVMLPDGNLMVTQVSPEEYASLELE